MQFKATINPQSHVHKKWKAKGIQPYTLMGVPFKWVPEYKSYQTDVLDQSQVSKLMENGDVILSVCTVGIPFVNITITESEPEKGEGIPENTEPEVEKEVNDETEFPVKRRGRPTKN